MMPLVTGVLQCYTALMEVGKLDLDERVIISLSFLFNG